MRRGISGNAELVASFFTDDGTYHASVGPDPLGKSYVGKDNIRRGVQVFFDRFPDGKFENLKVVVAGDIGTFEWDFVATDASGNKVQTAGCDLLQFVGDKVATKNAFRNSADNNPHLLTSVSPIPTRPPTRHRRGQWRRAFQRNRPMPGRLRRRSFHPVRGNRGRSGSWSASSSDKFRCRGRADGR